MLKIIIKNSKSVHKTEIKEKHIMSTLRNKTITLITKEESTLKKSHATVRKNPHKLDSDENKNKKVSLNMSFWNK